MVKFVWTWLHTLSDKMYSYRAQKGYARNSFSLLSKKTMSGHLLSGYLSFVFAVHIWKAVKNLKRILKRWLRWWCIVFKQFMCPITSFDAINSPHKLIRLSLTVAQFGLWMFNDWAIWEIRSITFSFGQKYLFHYASSSAYSCWNTQDFQLNLLCHAVANLSS